MTSDESVSAPPMRSTYGFWGGRTRQRKYQTTLEPSCMSKTQSDRWSCLMDTTFPTVRAVTTTTRLTTKPAATATTATSQGAWKDSTTDFDTYRGILLLGGKDSKLSGEPESPLEKVVGDDIQFLWTGVGAGRERERESKRKTGVRFDRRA